jgi:hypothetical protein
MIMVKSGVVRGAERGYARVIVLPYSIVWTTLFALLIVARLSELVEEVNKEAGTMRKKLRSNK